MRSYAETEPILAKFRDYRKAEADHEGVVRSELLNEYLSKLLANLDAAKVKAYQDVLAANPFLGGWKG